MFHTHYGPTFCLLCVDKCKLAERAHGSDHQLSVDRCKLAKRVNSAKRVIYAVFQIANSIEKKFSALKGDPIPKG